MRTTIRVTMLVLASVWIGACDPAAKPEDGKAADSKADASKTDDGKTDAAQPDSKADASKTAELAAPEPAAAPETLDGCLTECEQAILSEDDRATCRLRCKSTYGAEPSAKHPTVGAYFGCADGCVDKSADDRPTCYKNCAASVTAGSGDPNASACPRACMEALGTCLSPCEDKPEDDAATCRKQCEGVANGCVSAC